MSSRFRYFVNKTLVYYVELFVIKIFDWRTVTNASYKALTMTFPFTERQVWVQHFDPPIGVDLIVRDTFHGARTPFKQLSISHLKFPGTISSERYRPPSSNSNTNHHHPSRVSEIAKTYLRYVIVSL